MAGATRATVNRAGHASGEDRDSVPAPALMNHVRRYRSIAPIRTPAAVPRSEVRCFTMRGPVPCG